MVLPVMMNTSCSKHQFASRFEEDRVIIKHPNDGWHPCQALYLYLSNFSSTTMTIYVCKDNSFFWKNNVSIRISAKENFHTSRDKLAAILGNKHIIICGFNFHCHLQNFVFTKFTSILLHFHHSMRIHIPHHAPPCLITPA